MAEGVLTVRYPPRTTERTAAQPVKEHSHAMTPSTTHAVPTVNTSSQVTAPSEQPAV
ncbi:hypothetical protein [Streptomyces sp. NPDC003863]